MEANKNDCEKCIRIARAAASNDDFEKAIKFAEKAERLYSNELAKTLLSEYKAKLEESKSGGDANSNNSNSNEQQQQHQQDGNEYPRKRNTNPSRKGAADSGQPEPKSTSPVYTSEQMSAVKKIKSCRDFYDILGVTKQASEAELKKAYRKLALQFHPDKNQAPGSAEAFKSIGKAFSILSDTRKRQHYDHDPESFYNENGNGGDMTHRSSRRGHQQYHGGQQQQQYWNDDEFSPEELFNMFFGGNYATATQRRRQAAHNQNAHGHTTHANGQQNPNFVFSSNTNSYAVLFQLMPILLIVILSLLSNFMIGEPLYNLQKTNKYNVRRTTQDHHVGYFVKPDFRWTSQSELRKMERQVEEDLHIELRQNCYREKSHKETAVWRARNYGDERLLRKAMDYETPSCDRIHHIFGGG